MTEHYTTAEKNLMMGKRNRAYSKHWQPIDGKINWRGKSKKILMLPGNGADNERAANGMCTVVESLIDKLAKNCEIFGFYYPDGGRRYSAAARALKLLDECLVPLIADKTPLGDLKRLSKEEACENMRNVVVVTHCYGSRIIAAADKKLDEIMQQIGYSIEEIKDIHRQLCVFHQNSPQEDMGQEQMNSTNLYRITQADERNLPIGYENCSFPNFVATEHLDEDELLLAPINENEQALILAKITDKPISEHNGAYWITKKEKLPIAQAEDDLFKNLIQEIVGSTYYIEGWSQIFANVLQQYPQLQSIILQSRHNGQKYIDNFRNMQSTVRAEYKQSVVKIKKGGLNIAEVVALSPETLFVSDKKKKNLLDYAVDMKDWQTVENLWKVMQKYMPIPVAGERLRLTYEGYSVNYLEAKEKQKTYLQQALNEDNPQMFAIFAQPGDWLPELDYKNAGEKTAFLAGAAYKKLPKDYEEHLFSKYVTGLIGIYKRCSISNNIKMKKKVLPTLGKKLIKLNVIERQALEKALS